MFKLPSFLACLALSTAAAAAHEYWIDVEDYTIAPGETLRAATRVGTEYEGGSHAYIPRNYRRFDLLSDGTDLDYTPRIGDRPAVATPLSGGGLHVAIQVTRDYDLAWDSWDAFVEFTRDKGADWVLAVHADRGLPETAGLREVYSRYAKALVAVGDGAGRDRPHDLETEIVALENPYTDETADGLDVRLLYQGRPRPDAQIEVFSRDGADVAMTTLRTDAAGVATIPVSPGTTYLLNAVHLREPSTEKAADTGALWESLWASLTFAVPD